jgi:hypothetical protein
LLFIPGVILTAGSALGLLCVGAAFLIGILGHKVGG